MTRIGVRLLGLVLVLAIGVLLGRSTGRSLPATTSAKAAIIKPATTEAELQTVELTPVAEQRLGVVTVAAEAHRLGATRSIGGEVVAPPGSAAIIAAPVAGTLRAGNGEFPRVGDHVSKGQILFRLMPVAPMDRDQRAQAERQVATIEARLMALRSQRQRAELLATEHVGSERTAEDARATEAASQAELVAAQKRLALLDTAPLESDVALPLRAPHAGVLTRVLGSFGQTLVAGTPVFEVADTRTAWIRVPVYVGEVARLDVDAPARIHSLSATPAEARVAKLVATPPIADATAASTDRFYALDNGDGALRPGQRVVAILQYREATAAVTVPQSAIVYDFHGNAWLYEKVAAHTYRRQRVEVARVEAAHAVIARGIRATAPIVSVGATELFGVEFGAGK